MFTVDDSWADCLERKLKYHPQHTCLSIDDACRLIDLQTAQQNQANLKRLREVLESLGYKPAKILLPNGERAKRLARQTGCKHIQVDVDRCLMGRY
jgi:DNA polymerase III psi subunit